MLARCRDRLLLVLPENSSAVWQNMRAALDGSELQTSLPLKLPRTAHVLLWRPEGLVAILIQEKHSDDDALTAAIAFGARSIVRSYQEAHNSQFAVA